MAEDKIAAEERSAVSQLRSVAADAAAKAATQIIGERHDSAADEALVNDTLNRIGAR